MLTALGIVGKAPPAAKPAKQLLPVSLVVGASKFEFTNCEWESQSESAKEEETLNSKLHTEVSRLRERIEQLEKEKLKQLESRYIVEFKNKLLLEMLASAQLDADKNHSLLCHQKVKTEALKYELASLKLYSESIQ